MFINMIYILILSFNVSIISRTISIKRTSLKIFFIMTSLIYIPSYLLYLFNMNVFLVPLSVIIIFSCYFWASKDITSAIFISVFTQIIFALGDAVTGIVFVWIFKVHYYQIQNNGILSLILALGILIISFIISNIAYKFTNNKYFKNLKDMNKKNMFIFFLCLITALLIVYSYIIIFKSLSQSTNKTAVVVNVFLRIIFFVLLITIVYSNNKDIKKDLEQKYMNIQFKQLKEYTSMLELVSSDLRSFKHDYLNIMSIIGDYLDSKNYNELDEFYRTELKPESIKILEKNRTFMLLKNIKIDPLKGIISSKIIIAQSKEIIVTLSITDDIDNLSIDILDICRILGVLLDNAIEAAESCNNKFIEIVIFKNDNSTTFIIKNSCSENTPPIHKIYEENFSTKGVERGIGLKSVSKIINKKYKNVLLNTKIENLVFQQELIIC